MSSTGPVRVVRAVRGEDAGAWAGALGGGAWLSSARTLKAEGGARVLAASLLGRGVVVKVREIRGPWARLKCALGRGKGDRHWRGAALLTGKGIATARVFALARGRLGGRECEMLAMEHVHGPTLLRVMDAARRGGAGAPGVREQHALARAVGLQVARMGELFNRDHKPSNLIVRGGEIVVIDCEGVRRAVIPGAARMFASLLIEPTGCGVPPRRSLRMRAVLAWAEAGDAGGGRAAHRAAAREAWAEAARVVSRHGDPTPRVNPLN
jgi:tRNA A-37 threonylcarbamoyl transferase component Bud32